MCLRLMASHILHVMLKNFIFSHTHPNIGTVINYYEQNIQQQIRTHSNIIHSHNSEHYIPFSEINKKKSSI